MGERPWEVTNRIGLSLVCVALVIGLGIKYPTFLTVDNLFVTLLSVTSIGRSTGAMSGKSISVTVGGGGVISI